MGNHALLSASSSHRWLNCPPSARLGENYEDRGSDFAAEGTDAHSLCEHKLKTVLGIPSEDPTENLTWYNEEMEECASGYAAYAKTWANKTTAWEDLCERLKNTIRTTETVEEYPKLKKDDRDRAKDKGGFVGGYLKGNRRKRETVACRSMLTMDADHAEIGFIDRFASECRYSSCLYTTHGHTPEQPRCRIIVPLTRDITPDEYVALARYFASDWGIDQFDECSYKPSQLMYWPTTPANGEFICETTEGEWLDPDVYLSAHPNWKDCSLLPTSSRESAVREASGKKQEDPLAKPGVVGAFCRAYALQNHL